MNGNILRQSLRFNLVSMGSYTVGLLVYALFIAALYPSIKSIDYSQFIEQMPEAFLKAFGVESTSLFAPGGVGFADYVGIEYAFYLPIIAGFFAVFAAGGAIAREMDHGTLDPLLAQPIPRWSLLLSKFAAFAVGVGVIMLGSVVGLLLGIALTREDVSFDIGGLLLMHLHGGMLVVALGALGILFSVLFLDGGKAWGATGVVLFGSYLVHVVSGLADWAERFRYVSFFYYWRPREVFGTGSLEGSSLLVFIGVALVALLAALWVFEKRELVR